MGCGSGKRSRPPLYHENQDAAKARRHRSSPGPGVEVTAWHLIFNRWVVCLFVGPGSAAYGRRRARMLCKPQKNTEYIQTT